jgi:hypothetical protein
VLAVRCTLCDLPADRPNPIQSKLQYSSTPALQQIPNLCVLRVFAVNSTLCELRTRLDEAGQDGGVDQESGDTSVKALFKDAAVGFELGNVFVAKRPGEFGF